MCTSSKWIASFVTAHLKFWGDGAVVDKAKHFACFRKANNEENVCWFLHWLHVMTHQFGHPGEFHVLANFQPRHIQQTYHITGNHSTFDRYHVLFTQCGNCSDAITIHYVATMKSFHHLTFCQFGTKMFQPTMRWLCWSSNDRRNDAVNSSEVYTL